MSVVPREGSSCARGAARSSSATSVLDTGRAELGELRRVLLRWLAVLPAGLLAGCPRAAARMVGAEDAVRAVTLDYLLRQSISVTALGVNVANVASGAHIRNDLDERIGVSEG